MKIITAQGESNSGKTTLIRYVFIKLIQKGAKIIFFENRGADKSDFHAVIVWKSFIIAFCSAGDIDKTDWKLVEEGLDLAGKYKANILINALSIDQGLTIGGYKNLLDKQYGIKDFEKDVIPIGSAKGKKKINYKKILKYIKQTSPCFYLDLAAVKQKKCKRLNIRKHRFTCCALFVILITIVANAVLNYFSKNDLYFLIFSCITTICLNIAIIASFFKPKRKTKYKAKLLSKALSNTEDILIQNGTTSKELADVHKSTANAIADI